MEYIKQAKSSIFPTNWNYTRIQEEIAWVYENTVAKGTGLKNITENGISNYEGLSSTGFQIRIQLKDGKIINSHPINI